MILLFVVIVCRCSLALLAPFFRRVFRLSAPLKGVLLRLVVL